MRIPIIPAQINSYTVAAIYSRITTSEEVRAMKRNQFGNIRKLASGRYQVRNIDQVTGQRLTAKGIDGASLTFASEKDARNLLAYLNYGSMSFQFIQRV